MRYLAVGFIAIFLSLPTQIVAASSGRGCVNPVGSAAVGGLPSSVPNPSPAVTGPLTPASVDSGVVLNEVLLAPRSIWNCSAQSVDTNNIWIELYNPQNQSLDLSAVHASIDTGPASPSYRFPLGSAIAAHGFLVLFPPIGALFAVNPSSTNTLRLLIAGEEQPIDQITVPQLTADQSYARISNGIGDWQITNAPTIDASNVIAQAPPDSVKSADAAAAPESSKTKAHSSGSHINRSTSAKGSIGTYETTQRNNTSSSTPSNGIQPIWNALRLPAMATPGTDPHSSLFSPLADLTGSGVDTTRYVTLTLIALALALSLFRCWRVFTVR